jgi:hypothetical protein
MKDEVIGLTELEELTVKCGDCGTPLVNVVLTETNDLRTERGLKPQRLQFKLLCYKCGGTSFPTKVLEGSAVVGTLKDDIETDEEDTDLVDGVIVTTLKTRQK